jgi:hypothetical protein
MAQFLSRGPQAINVTLRIEAYLGPSGPYWRHLRNLPLLA